MCVVKTGKHIHVQLIDDVKGHTLVSVSTQDKELQAAGCKRKSKQAGQLVGEKVALRSKEKGITTVIFDRGLSKYHGILAAIADAARQQGLQF
jgi:large subunit ribosomal protein L18